jgi:malate synthase
VKKAKKATRKKKAPGKSRGTKKRAVKHGPSRSAAKRKGAKRQTATKTVARSTAKRKSTKVRSAAKSGGATTNAKSAARTGAAARAGGARTGASRPVARGARARGGVRGARSPNGRGGTPDPRRLHARSRARPPVNLARGIAGVAITGAIEPRYHEILTPEALTFLAELHRRFDRTRQKLLAARALQQRRYDAGEKPDFLPETEQVRESDWKIAPIPSDLRDRRVEITGPVDRKMVINALNSGANVYMADFEDANSPTWDNNLEGQINLKDRWQGKLDFVDPETSKQYRLRHRTAVLIVRPRGWHLTEAHLTVDGAPISAALFDFGLSFFHNAKAQIAKGTGPYFYLPKLETHLEARLWNDVFVFAQDALGIPRGTIKATVLIETLPAAFEMDEILWEMRDHIAGLNAGRWDYIFSFIKKFAKNPNYILPDRSQVVMGKAFLGAYAQLLIRTCHRRGAFAMGGMAAQIPVRNNPKANDAAFAKVREDKEREVRDGNDGTWVAHPGLVPVAREVFARLSGPNQLDRLRDDVHVTSDMLLTIHEGTKTEDGFRHNIRVGVQYIEAWLRGRGAVPIYNLMEDAATAEISRAQIWQWIKYGVRLDDGVTATRDLFERALGEEMERVREEIGQEAYDAGRFPEAIALFRDLALAEEFPEFLTIPAYRLIV